MIGAVPVFAFRFHCYVWCYLYVGENVQGYQAFFCWQFDAESVCHETTFDGEAGFGCHAARERMCVVLELSVLYWSRVCCFGIMRLCRICMEGVGIMSFE